jgi:hypothetical protein
MDIARDKGRSLSIYTKLLCFLMIGTAGGNMKFIIIRGRFSKHFFGIQIVFGRYTVQYAFHKVGIYNSCACKWWPC